MIDIIMKQQQNDGHCYQAAKQQQTLLINSNTMKDVVMKQTHNDTVTKQ
jgi:hypothetical protein